MAAQPAIGEPAVGSARVFDIVFVDGAFVPTAEAALSVHANAASYGTGTFEGIRATWNDEAGELYLLEAAAHFDRLRRSANTLGLALPYSTEELVAITIELLRRNDARCDTYIRPLLLLAGEVIRVRMHDVEQRLSIAVSPFTPRYTVPELRCIVSSWRRAPDNSIPARAKVIGSYVGSALAKTEAVRAGCDEAIMLTAGGAVAEATTSNIFLRRGSHWITPAPTDDILEGITRRQVIELIDEELGETVVERTVDRSELYVCDEALLCGTAVSIVPVIEVDHRPVGDGRPGARTQRLVQAWTAIARGESDRHRDWTTPVYG